MALLAKYASAPVACFLRLRAPFRPHGSVDSNCVKSMTSPRKQFYASESGAERAGRPQPLAEVARNCCRIIIEPLLRVIVS